MQCAEEPNQLFIVFLGAILCKHHALVNSVCHELCPSLFRLRKVVYGQMLVYRLVAEVVPVNLEEVILVNDRG